MFQQPEMDNLRIVPLTKPIDAELRRNCRGFRSCDQKWLENPHVSMMTPAVNLHFLVVNFHYPFWFSEGNWMAIGKWSTNMPNFVAA